MSKKVVLIGPYASGKSTLRHILFESSSLSSLLENPLEPTYGVEVYRYNLFQDLGIFDLAGQELERWFNEESNVFQNSDLIINIFDSSLSLEVIRDFLDKALSVEPREEQNAKIVFLAHKRDLINKQKEQDIKALFFEVYKKLHLKRIISLYFTSIKPEFFNETFGILLNLLQGLNLTEEMGDFKFNKINFILWLFQTLNSTKTLSLSHISSIFEPSYPHIENVISDLIRAGYLEILVKNSLHYIELTEKGKQTLHDIKQGIDFEISSELGEISLQLKESKQLQENIESALSLPSLSQLKEKKIPHEDKYLIYGFLISDPEGRCVLKWEPSPGYLSYKLTSENSRNEYFDIELVPMFISALQKFSEEINVKSLEKIDIKGKSMKLYCITVKDLVFTIFTKSDFDLDRVYNSFYQKVLSLLSDFSSELEFYRKSGNVTPLMKMTPYLDQLIQEVHEEYREPHKDISSNANFDEQYASAIYEQLANSIAEEYLSSDQLLTIKDLKLELLEAILKKDANQFEKVKEKILNFCNMIQ